MEKTSAILLRRTRYSETSLILTWLSLDFGKVKTMAQGALRPKNRFAGKLDLFFEADLAFARSSRSEIHALREVVLVNPYPSLRRFYRHVEVGAYFVELLELATEPEHPVPELYDLLKRALGYLEGLAAAESAKASRKAVLHFESELARMLGIAATGSSASALLAQTLHRLPEGRGALLAKLAE